MSWITSSSWTAPDGGSFRAAHPVGLAALFQALAALAGCTEGTDDPPLQPAELAEVCGGLGPFPLLPLAPDERPHPFFHNVAAIGDRLLFVIGTGLRRVDSWSGPIPEHSAVHAVGLCGENPVIVGPGVDQVLVDPSWPGVVLGCTEEVNHLVRLDPSGAADPTEVGDTDCPVSFTKHGIVAPDRNLGYSFFPTLDPKEAIFGEPLVLSDYLDYPFDLTSDVLSGVFPDEILLIDGDQLVRLGLPELTRTVEVDTGAFVVSEDGRFLLYEGENLGGGDVPDEVEIYIRDRSDGRSRLVGTGSPLNDGRSGFRGADFATVESSWAGTTVISLPEFGFFPVPGDYALRNRLPDGRWLTIKGQTGSWHVLDLATGETTLVTESNGYALSYTNENLDLLVGESSSNLGTLPLHRFFFDPAQQSVRLARRVTSDATFQDDGRILTSIDIDDLWLGPLIIVDPDTQEEGRIDDRVVYRSVRPWHAGEPDAVTYAVVDGERTGVWLARPAPRD